MYVRLEEAVVGEAGNAPGVEVQCQNLNKAEPQHEARNSAQVALVVRLLNLSIRGACESAMYAVSVQAGCVHGERGMTFQTSQQRRTHRA